MTVRRVNLVKYESYHGIFINNLTSYFTNVETEKTKTARPPSDTARFIRVNTNRNTTK